MSAPEVPAYITELEGFTLLDALAGIGYVDPPITGTSSNPTWVHWCEPPAESGYVTRWGLGNTPLHTVVQRDPLTMTASLLCPDCGCHGWITEGRWISV